MVRERRTGEEDVNRRAAADGRPATGGSTLDPRTLDEIIRRVVEVAQPERIVLFGSAARGEMTRHSDVDLLIVSDRGDALDLMRRIYRRLGGVGIPVDALVVSTADVARYRDSHALVIKPALREGRTVYESAGAPSPRRPAPVSEPGAEPGGAAGRGAVRGRATSRDHGRSRIGKIEEETHGGRAH